MEPTLYVMRKCTVNEFSTEDSRLSLQYGCLGQSIRKGQVGHHCAGTATMLNADLMKGRCKAPSVMVGMRGVFWDRDTADDDRRNKLEGGSQVEQHPSCCPRKVITCHSVPLDKGSY
jgi:hypothetical protein